MHPRSSLALVVMLAACVEEAPPSSPYRPSQEPSLAPPPALVTTDTFDDGLGLRLVGVSPTPGTVDGPLTTIVLDFVTASGLDPLATALQLTTQGLVLTEGQDLVRDVRRPDRLVVVLQHAVVDLDLHLVPVDRQGRSAPAIDLQWRGRRDVPVGPPVADHDRPLDHAPASPTPPTITSRLGPFIAPTLVPVFDAHDDADDVVALGLTRAGIPIAALTLDSPASSTTLFHDFVSTPSGPLVLVAEAVDATGTRAQLTLSTTVDADPPTIVPDPTPADARSSFELGATFADAGAGLDVAFARVLTADDVPIVASVLPGARAAHVVFQLTAPPGEHLVELAAADRVGLGQQLIVPVVVKDPDERTAAVVVTPPDGASLVGPRTPLVFHFGAPVVAPAAPLMVMIDDAPVAGRVAVDATTIAFQPDAPWPPSALVEAFVEGLTTPGGEPVARLRTNFRVRPYGFIDVAADSPELLAYRAATGEAGENHGPGGLFADLDLDGYPDLALAAAPREPLVVFHNVPGPSPSGRVFAPIVIAPASSRGQTGVVGGDVDNDGDLDLFVAVWDGPDRLYQNRFVEDGTLAFVDVTAATAPSNPAEPGLATSSDTRGPLDLTMTAAFADVDRDGRLDLYVGHHNGHWRSPQLGDVAGQRDTLFLQQADGTFRDATLLAGVPGWSAVDGSTETADQRFSSTDAVLFTDLDEDRWPDLVVTNKLRHPDDRQMLYRNLGAAPDGTWLGFEVLTYWVDPALPTGHELPMGVDANDLDHDGDIDLYITDWAPYGTVPGPNQIWLNQFSELGRVDFVAAPGASGVYAWGTQIQDFDNDGHLDIHVATNIAEWDLLYRGPGFVDIAQAADVRQRTNARGVMSADLDRDGRVDLVVVNLDAPPRVYWNRFGLETPQPSPQPNPQHWLSVKLLGDPELPGPHRSTRDAIGARLIAHLDLDGDGAPERMAREVRSGSSNAASTSSLELELGLGQATLVDLEIRWPSGRTTWLYAVPSDQHLIITEAP